MESALNAILELYPRYYVEQGYFPFLAVGCRDESPVFAMLGKTVAFLDDPLVLDTFDEKLSAFRCSRSCLVIPVKYDTAQYLIAVDCQADEVAARFIAVKGDPIQPEFWICDSKHPVIDGRVPLVLQEGKSQEGGDIHSRFAVARQYAVDRNEWKISIPVDFGKSSVIVDAFPDVDLSVHNWYAEPRSGEVYRFPTDDEYINGVSDPVWLCCEILVRSDMRLGLFKDFEFEDVIAVTRPYALMESASSR